ITTTRFGTPIWIAARPIPGASYIVSSMSSARARISSVMRSTGAHFVRRRGSGRRTSGRIDMGGEIRTRHGRVKSFIFCSETRADSRTAPMNETAFRFASTSLTWGEATLGLALATLALLLVALATLRRLRRERSAAAAAEAERAREMDDKVAE